MSQKCQSCGKPLERAEDHAQENENLPFCSQCVDEKGELKSYDEILNGVTQYLTETQGMEPFTASMLAEQLMKTLPAWKKNQ